MNLKEWRKEQGWTQGELALKLSTNQGSYHGWENARTTVPREIQAKLKKLGYTGPWPHEEAKEQVKDFISREEYNDLKAALKAHVDYWRAGEERVLEKLMEQARRIAELEKRLSEL